MGTRIIICDDDSLIRESLNILLPLKGDIEIVGIARDGREAVTLCLENEVDLALLDIRMPNMTGVEATKLITEKTNTKCLILTTFDEEEYVNEALSYGAKGYILKNSSPEQIVSAIDSVINGSVIMNENILDKIHGSYVKPCVHNTELTDREVEVIEWISEGLNNKEIAAKIFISEGTVRNYISSILLKTGLKDRTQVAVNYLKGKL